LIIRGLLKNSNDFPISEVTLQVKNKIKEDLEQKHTEVIEISLYSLAVENQQCAIVSFIWTHLYMVQCVIADAPFQKLPNKVSTPLYRVQYLQGGICHLGFFKSKGIA
jgi:hypothetical protein